MNSFEKAFCFRMVLSVFIFFQFAMISCRKADVRDTSGNNTLPGVRPQVESLWGETANPDNPYDYVGLLHNQAMDFIVNREDNTEEASYIAVAAFSQQAFSVPQQAGVIRKMHGWIFSYPMKDYRKMIGVTTGSFAATEAANKLFGIMLSKFPACYR
ncbi:MAG TPA: hypothetical protein VM802_06925 [Chitinophaga sp.]|uniref:hypothetical protein n=1 Tax=Chitinophaga sp. TaxID=1869181 RepID=UPI002D14A4E7|nr:hypothetical protein [Chitinophaga sp.]HVI44583.1 hypothetical protein [Chitinophaga sp.]